MINKKFLGQLKEEYKTNEIERRQIISAANSILFDSKKTIFALQRQEEKIATKRLKELENNLIILEKRFGIKRLNKEGSYRAAAEEYLEAKTFFLVIKNRQINKVSSLNLDYESYLGGLCDLIGELVRYSINQATQGKFSAVGKNKKIADDIMAGLSDFDMTGYLRTKYDQARGHLRKLEQMAYEIKLRTKK